MPRVPVILINLDRSTDRLEHMHREFARTGMTFERFPAVNGTDLPDSVKPYFCNASGKIVSPLRPGEIGCYASHLGIWQRIAAGVYGPAVLVCEDDIVLPDDLDDLLAHLLAALPEQWDVVRLSSKTHRAVAVVAPLGGSQSLVRYTRSPLLSGATLVSRAGAEKLIAPGIRHEAVDGDLARPWKFDLNDYGVLPTPLPQGNATSAIREVGGRCYRRRRLSQWFSPDKPRRLVHNLRKMTLRQWLTCLATNTAHRLGLTSAP